jgi:hypothetical protein
MSSSYSLSLKIILTLLNQVPASSQSRPPPLNPKPGHLKLAFNLNLQAFVRLLFELNPNPYHIHNLRNGRCTPPATRAWSIPIHLPSILQQRLLLPLTQPSIPIRVMHTVLKPTRTHEL